MPRMLPSPRHRRVAIVIYDRLCTFEFGIAAEMFALPRPELGVPWYTTRVCSLESGSCRATGGVTIQADADLRTLAWAGTVVLPGWRDAAEAPPAALIRALRAANRRGARFVSICSGVFLLAAAGLIDGKRVTTHWKYIERLQARHPRVRVEPDVLYVEDGRILTSAGSAAGLDACLHLVHHDYGADVAHRVARRLVMPPQRDGGQRQYIPAPVKTAQSGVLASTLEWMQRHLAEPMSVAILARRAVMSTRTFVRRFYESTGTTPLRWLTRQRVFEAQRLLETTGASIDDVASAVGLGSAATLRHHFARVLSTTPTGYRRQFSHTSLGRRVRGNRPPR